MKNRTEGYVPDGLHSWRHVGEINQLQEVVPIALGLADELNRDSHGEWWWADMHGDGSHWSRYDGHRIQVDIEFHTNNRREINDWKGRDEIRGEGTWHLKLNRQPIWEGYFGTDFMWVFNEIPWVIRRLEGHEALDWNKGTPVKEQLLGRKVYYRDTPAVVRSTVLQQGCVMLAPVSVDVFPVPAKYRDHKDDDWPEENNEVKTTLLDKDVWWFRDKEFNGDEVS